MTEQAQGQPFWEALALPAPGTHMTAKQFDAMPEVIEYLFQI
jgi:hypothetical protein